MYRVTILAAVIFTLFGQQVIVAQNSKKPAAAANSKEKPTNATKIDLDALGAKLKAAIASGKMTEEEAIEVFKKAAAGQAKDDKAKKGQPGKDSKPASVDLEALGAKLKAAVAAGKLTDEEALAIYNKAAAGQDKFKDGEESKPAAKIDLYKLFRLVEEGELTAKEAMAKYKAAATRKDAPAKKNFPGKPQSLEDLKKLSQNLPVTSTGTDKEGPNSTFIFGWAGNATHRFMDNSHLGKPRQIRGISFRLDYREHDAIGRTWENVTVRVGHGNFSSIQYNKSREYELVDEPVTVFDKQWSFPALKGFPPLEPASWGGPQNSLSFRFDEPFQYNGKDAIYVEFIFSGGRADDGREWKGELPRGFEYFLDSMPEVGGWRVALENSRSGGIYRGPARVAAVTSYTAGGQSVWTSSPKGMPFIRWDE